MGELPEKCDLPQKLLEADRFIIWFEEKRGDKHTKIPSAPWRTKHFGSASVMDPENWADFDTALEYARRKKGYGVGFCFSEEDDIVGIDLDDCINEEGEVEKWASDIINSVGSYTELSPSEKGIHIFLKGKIPRAIKQNEEGVEAYNSKRFFTLTGRSLKKGRGVLRENQEFLNELWERYGEEDIVIEHELEKSGLDFPITKLFETGHLDKNKFRRVGSEYRGSHPIHGSTTGTNLNINPEKNSWICRRHGCGGGSLSLLGVIEGVFECGSWSSGETPLREKKWFETLEKAEDHGLITEEDIKRWKEPEVSKYFEKRKFIPKRLAEAIMEDFQFITFEDTKETYAYNEGVFQPNGETVIESEAQERLGEYSRRSYENEVVNFIQLATFIPRSELDNNPQGVVVKNGVLKIKSRKLESYSPNPPLTTKIPVVYDPEAKCPRIMNFLKDILNPDDIPTIQEGMGYCLLKDYPIAAAFMLIGSGANGKSTLLNLISCFLGEENVATPSLQDLLTNRFAKAELYGKLANIHADIPASKLKSTGAFKMLTGQDLIHAEKKFQSAFTFRNYGKLWYSCNELPYTSDRTRAFFDRWILVDFPNTFPRDDPKTDPHIIEKITTDEELSGLLNWALDGLDRLLERGYFKKSKSRGEVEAEWILQTDSIRAFVMRRCERDPNAEIPKSDFYDAYLDFCDDLGLSVAAKNTVGRRLPSIAPYVRVSRPKIHGKRVRCWQGINLYNHVRDVQDKTNIPIGDMKGRKTSSDSIKKEVQLNLDMPDRDIKAFPPADVSNVRTQIHNWLRKNSLKKKEILLKYSRPEWNLVEAVLKKMAKESEIFRDEDRQWRLTNA